MRGLEGETEDWQHVEGLLEVRSLEFAILPNIKSLRRNRLRPLFIAFHEATTRVIFTLRVSLLFNNEQAHLEQHRTGTR